MFGSIFYHNLIRKYTTAFGNMFNDIIVRRFDANNNTLQTMQIPISYGSKAKFLQLILRNPVQEKVAIQLPRMAFQITGINYDPERKINPTHKNSTPAVNYVLKTQFVPIAYKIDYELAIMVNSTDDGAQILEQIIPYFTPSFSNEILLVPELNLKNDIKTTMTGISITDDSEGSADESRTIIWTLSFSMDVWFFGPVTNQGVIKRVQVDIIPVPNEEGWNTSLYGRGDRVVITPGLTANGVATSNASLTVPYSEIQPDDPYGFITQIYNFTDGKKYDPKSGTDK